MLPVSKYLKNAIFLSRFRLCRNEIMLQVTEQSLLVRTHVYSSASACGHVHVQEMYGTVVCRIPIWQRVTENIF